MPPSGDKNPTSKPDGSALTTGPSIAVMPLTNLTGDKEQDYFVDGLTEELTAEIMRCQDFQVIASQSTMQFKGQEILTQKLIGRDLGVQFLLQGSVRRDSKTVKVYDPIDSIRPPPSRSGGKAINGIIQPPI